MELDEDACYRALLARDPRFDGRLFTGVKTTGIYCRPICPARTPLRRNVRFFPTAAAAQEAGFRPCLRCRPESSPDLGAWRGASNTVSRGLALIEDGALDGEADVERLAARLGVGGRQLRRLFRQHLGASPVAVAQTRRVLLAKQLLHQTRLPMTQVALASGFSSLRRFNETFQTLYRRSPSALRRDGLEIAAAPGAWIRVSLPYAAPYDWPALIDFLAVRAIDGVEKVTPGRYLRVIELNQAIGLLAVTPAEGSRLDVAINFPSLRALPAILARVRRIFDLAADPAAIAADLGRDPDLAPRLALRPGLRTPGAWDVFEVAVRGVVGQQISVTAAIRLASKIAADFGPRLPADLEAHAEGLTHAFPSAGTLARADLSGLPMPRARSRAIEALAMAAASDPTVLAPGPDLESTVERLCTLPGIGPWTAHYIALRGLRDPDAFMAGDVGLQRALVTADGVRPSAAELSRRAEAWRPWRGYAALHLWTTPVIEGGERERHAA
ncbi:MAG TPA: AlkA N-terminal domain-containing protein [Caulobacteraceae bacterium]|jgi:AraC family transcriptional regulator of adaptative response / DNA-3-methyladenine glycosylase II|nr:AlkA N-terminal domain-containing protein [Caulobacteraceae bacterium]